MLRLFRPVALLSLLAIFAAQTPAQSLQPRIRARIAGAERQGLPATREPRALPEADQGPLPGNQQIEGMALVFKHSAAQQADLDALLAAQVDPKSSQFHQWLTPETFAARFGMADADLQQASTWLQSFGFTVQPAPASRDRLVFSGTAAEVATAFGTELHHYTIEGEQHFAPASALTLPAPLAAVAGGVLHLSDFKPKPQSQAASAAQPAYTDGSSATHYLVPADMPVMYDLPATALPGALLGGQTLAVVGESYIDPTSGAQRHLMTRNFTTALVPDTGIQAVYPGVQFEAQLDVEYASAASVGNVLYLYTGDRIGYGAFDAMDFAITSNVASIISVSFGECETLMSPAALDQLNGVLMQAAAQGQTVVGSAGDLGSTACATYPVSTTFTAAQQQALAVQFPTASPFVLAMGGTQMQPGTFAAGSSSYWASFSDVLNSHSLLSYVPEAAWNEGASGSLPLAGGGGASMHFARPTWQTGVAGLPTGTTRLVPDLSLQASVHDPGFLVCTDDPGLGQPAASCPTSLTLSNPSYAIGGGTSFSAPIMAGLLARLNAETGTLRQGNIGPALYALAAQPASFGTALHDISSGTIACVAGATSCGPAGMSGYAAAPGFDEATGLGSIDYNQLLAQWPTKTPLNAVPDIFLNVSASTAGSPPNEASVYIMANTGGSGMDQATGTLQVRLDGAVVQPSLPLNTTGVGSYAQMVVTLPATPGSHLIVVSYPGDGKHLPSAGFTTINVGQVQATGSVSLSSATLAVPSNATATASVLATSPDGYHGTLLWKVTANSSYTTSVCYRIQPLIVTSTGSGTATLKIGQGSACASAAAFGSVRQSPAHLALGTPPHRGLTAGHAGALLACLLPMGFFGARRRGKRLPPLLGCFLFAGVTGLSGCGGSGAGNTTTGPAPAPTPTTQTITLTLTGTDSVNQGITASAPVTITLN